MDSASCRSRIFTTRYLALANHCCWKASGQRGLIMIAITGDLAYNRKWNRRSLTELARRLVGIAPVFFVTGNQDINCNDLPQMLKLLKDTGVEVLEGRSVTIKRGSEAIAVAGIDDPEIFHETKTSRKQALDWVESRRLELFAIAYNLTSSLSCCPTARSSSISMRRLGFDLVLAGHAHGGQVRLPLVGPLYAPDQGFFPRYASGMYTMGGTRMIVSRGLGRSHFPFRIFNRPELVVVRLTSLVQASP